MSRPLRLPPTHDDLAAHIAVLEEWFRNNFGYSPNCTGCGTDDLTARIADLTALIATLEEHQLPPLHSPVTALHKETNQ